MKLPPVVREPVKDSHVAEPVRWYEKARANKLVVKVEQKELPTMIMGFTGTQRGMTDRQISSLTQLLLKLRPTEWHHGDCIGADDESHMIARSIGTPRIVVHPPVDPKKRAYVEGGALSIIECGSLPFTLIVREPKPYIERNHDIVDESDEIIATPVTMHEEMRSGTWATVRYAQKVGKKVTLIMPDGTVFS